MTTVGDLVEEVRSILDGYYKFVYNWLDGGITTSATSLVLLDDVIGIDTGQLLGIEDELLLVRSAAVGTKTVTVKRGMRNTTAASHADAALVDVRPEYYTGRIRRALQQEIASWGPEVYRIDGIDVTMVGNQTTYSLGAVTDAYSILRAIRQDPSGANADAWTRVLSFRPIRNPDVDTIYIQIDDNLNAGTTVRVFVARPFDVTTTFTDSDDLITDLAMPTYTHDIAPLGAAWRLLGAREAPRASGRSQPEPRAATEVQPFQRMNVAAGFKKMRDERLLEVSGILARQWGGFSGV